MSCVKIKPYIIDPILGLYVDGLTEYPIDEELKELQDNV